MYDISEADLMTTINSAHDLNHKCDILKFIIREVNFGNKTENVNFIKGCLMGKSS